jgi:hypothetical protein
MLVAASTIIGAAVEGHDGSCGRIRDLFFSDDSWEVRYLVVDTGKWISDRQVLISPHVLRGHDWAKSTVSADLTKQQVERSPPLFADKPVSRQHETELADYFDWPRYWQASKMYSPMSTTLIPPVSKQMDEAESERVERELTALHEAEEERADPTLRSATGVFGFSIHARDGDLGHVEDFVVDDEEWTLRYLVVDTKNWWPGKKVLVAAQWIEAVHWIGRHVDINMRREQIRNSAEFDPSETVTANTRINCTTTTTTRARITGRKRTCGLKAPKLDPRAAAKARDH